MMGGNLASVHSTVLSHPGFGPHSGYTHGHPATWIGGCDTAQVSTSSDTQCLAQCTLCAALQADVCVYI